MTDAAEAEALRATLERARDLGFLGPGPVADHLARARGFLVAEASLGRCPRQIVDLGSGGGVPGLFLAAAWPESSVFLVESNSRRVDHLREAIADAGWEGRVEVVHARAEVAARDPRLREQIDLVSARSFAIPAVTAEIAAGFLVVGGVLVVSEPPEPDAARWPAGPLRELGFGEIRAVSLDAGHFVVLTKTAASDARVPRPTGRPAKRPLW